MSKPTNTTRPQEQRQVQQQKQFDPTKPENLILIGDKRSGAYAGRATGLLKEGKHKEVIFRAQGTKILSAIDAKELTKYYLSQEKITVSGEKETSGTEMMPNPDGTTRRVLSIEIVLSVQG